MKRYRDWAGYLSTQGLGNLFADILKGLKRKEDITLLDRGGEELKVFGVWIEGIWK